MPRKAGATAERSPVTLLAFELGGERFALPADQVREVVRAVAIAALPKAPPVVEGVINYRGVIVPVVDIRQRFDLGANPLSPDQHFIVAQAGERTLAIRVDRATELLAVPAEAIHAPGSAVPAGEYVSGIATLPDGLIVIHDLARFLHLDEANQLEAAIAAPPVANR